MLSKFLCNKLCTLELPQQLRVMLALLVVVLLLELDDFAKFPVVARAREGAPEDVGGALKHVTGSARAGTMDLRRRYMEAMARWLYGVCGVRWPRYLSQSSTPTPC